MIEPPPREEEFKIEWRCTKCGMEGTCGVGHNQDARKVFSRMFQNHKNRSIILVDVPDPKGRVKVLRQDRVRTCIAPTFKWARIA